MSIRVLIADKMDPRAAAVFRERGIHVDEKPGLAPDDLTEIIGDYDGLAVRSTTRVTAAVMDKGLPRLKVIGRAGIGVDTIDVPAASARGIVVMNTPFGILITTAEHAIAMLFALAREIPDANASTQAGKWEKNRFMGVELSGKTLGLIGCGNIGSIVADRAHGLKMKVVAYDPFLTPERALELGRQGRTRRAARPRRFHHPPHAADRPDPRDPVARRAGQDEEGRPDRQLRARRPDRRSGVQTMTAESGHVAGAALDVFSEEPAKDNPLFGTPASSAPRTSAPRPREAQVNVAIQIAEQMSDFLPARRDHQRQSTCPRLTAEEAPRLKPYIRRLPRSSGGWSGRSWARSPLDPRRSRGRGRGAQSPSRSPVRCWPALWRTYSQTGEQAALRALPGEGTRARRARDPSRPGEATITRWSR